jgi:hypothetical protein
MRRRALSGAARAWTRQGRCYLQAVPPGSTEFDTCGICNRTILRGERITEYVASDGARVGVCALCKDAAEDAGWVPAALAGTPASSSHQRRRGLGLRRRLSRVSGAARGLGSGSRGRRAAGPAGERELKFGMRVDSEAQAGEPSERAEQEARDQRSGSAGRRPKARGGEGATKPPAKRRTREQALRRALEMFNASAEPRKVAGLIRSLGEPRVAVRPSSGAATLVTVAWELSWYQWEVGGDENGAGVREAGKGSEVGELAELDQRWNATAASDGTVTLDSADAPGPSPESQPASG